MRFNQRLAIIISLCTATLIGLIIATRGIVKFGHIFGKHPGISVTQQETWDRYHGESKKELQPIPKKLHRIFHNWKDPGSNKLPEDWEKIRQTCIDKNPSWEHKVRCYPARIGGFMF